MSMLYHDTTIEALFSIIEQMTILSDIDESGQKKEHWVLPLRATHIGFLNDSTEGNLLPCALAEMNVSQKAVKSAVLQNGKQYVLSFSKKKDDLNMWRSYSDDGYGGRLGFDRDGLEKHVNELYKNDNPMSFAIQALSAKYLVENRDKVSREPGCMVNDVPLEIDQEVARRKLAFWGCEIDTLTPEQHRYLFGE